MGAKNPELQLLEDKAFAQAYVAKGFNGTQAVLEIKPHLEYKSANVEAAQRLANPSAREQIDACLSSVAETWQNCAKSMMIMLEADARKTTDVKLKVEIGKLFSDYGKLFAVGSAGPKNATQINLGKLPKLS